MCITGAMMCCGKSSYSGGWSAKLERGDKLQKRPYLGGGQMPRRVVGVQRKTLVWPVGKQLHQAAGIERRRQAKVEHLQHRMPVFTHAVQGAGVVDHQATVGAHDHLLALAVELPGKRAPGLRVAKV